MKKRTYIARAVFILILALLVGSVMVMAVPQPPPKTDAQGQTASAAGTAGAAQPGFVEIMQGKKVPAAMLKFYFDEKKVKPIKGLTKDCSNDISKCTKTDADKFETAQWKVSYDAEKNEWTNLDGGAKFKESDNGQYYAGGVVPNQISRWDNAQNDFIKVADFPSGKTIDDIAKVEEGLVYFKDSTVQVGSAPPVPQPIYEKYKSVIDNDEIYTITDNKIPLQNGGSLAYAKDAFGVTTLTAEVKDAKGNVITENSGTTWITPDGSSYTSSEGWKIIKEENGEFIIQQSEEKIKKNAIYVVDSGKKIVLENLETKEKTETLLLEENKKGIKEYKEKDKLVSWKVYGKDGTLLSEAEEFDDDGNVDEFRFYNAKGKIEGVCYGTSCTGEETNSVVWVTNDAFCTGAKSNCFDAAGNKKATLWQSEDNCKEDSLCDDAITAKEREGFFSGQTATQKTLGALLGGFKPGWHGISNLLAPETTREWQQAAAETFDKALAAEYIVPKLVCDYDAAQRTKVPGSSTVFIEVAPGVTQFVGGIQVEKSKGTFPILCADENTGEDEASGASEGAGEKRCPKNFECGKDGFCHEPGKKDPVQGFFYKIAWGVSAPSSPSFLPYRSSDAAVSFNVYVDDIPLYIGGKDAMKLKAGEQDKDFIVHYSSYDAASVCIKFKQPPADLSGEEVNEDCADITSLAPGKIPGEEAKKGSRGSTKVSSGEVGRNTDW